MNKHIEPKIVVYITCYQDEKSANICIQAIKSQSIKVTAIFIVDNSNIPLLISDNINNLISIKHYPNNVGIAQGLLEALEWSINKKYDFLWTFDQDSIPTVTCLETLLFNYYQLSQKDHYKVGIIAPTASDIKTGEVVEGATFFHDHFLGVKHNPTLDFYECDAPITSGSLISLLAAQTIAPPSADLFIDGIDLDYGLRLKQKGFHNLIVTKAVMFHNFGSPLKVKFMNKRRFLQQYSALRHYYICRNHTYLETRFSQGYYRFTSVLKRIKYLISSIFWIVIFDPENKYLKIWACLLGTYHGLQGKLSKNW